MTKEEESEKKEGVMRLDPPLSLDAPLGHEAMRAVYRSLGEVDLGDETARIQSLGILASC